MLLVAVRVPQATPPLAEMLATVMLGVPVSPEATVAVAALPEQLPELPVQLPVTLPEKVPETTPPAMDMTEVLPAYQM